MVRVIPAILVNDQAEFTRRVSAVSEMIDLVQIDVMDGQFVPQISWADPVKIKTLNLSVFFEAHLMIREPEKIIARWVAVADRIIFHFESTARPQICIKQIREYNKKVGLAINPETSVRMVVDLLPQVDVVTVMAVKPGRMGQAFIEETKQKITDLHRQFPALSIEVDGGVKKERLAELYNLGVREFVLGSAIFNAAEPAGELKEYLKILENADKRSTLN